MGRAKGAGEPVSPTVARRLSTIEACERRGESLKAYAERTGQSVWAFYEAKRVARRAGVLPPPRGAKRAVRVEATRPRPRRFVEAVAPRPASVVALPGAPVVWRLRLPGGAILESTTALDAALLGPLLNGGAGRS